MDNSWCCKCDYFYRTQQNNMGTCIGVCNATSYFKLCNSCILGEVKKQCVNFKNKSTNTKPYFNGKACRSFIEFFFRYHQDCTPFENFLIGNTLTSLWHFKALDSEHELKAAKDFLSYLIDEQKGE